MTPHRWRDVIVAWANGETLQWRVGEVWKDYPKDYLSPPFGSPDIEWRIKPKTVTYRVALMRGKDLAWATAALNEADEGTIEKLESFSRWLTDRITVEV